MTFICLQAGHYPRTSGATGAPGEQDINKAVWLKLSEILQSKGFQIQLVGADPKPEELKTDFDLFLSLHCDANIYGTGGGVIGAPEPSTDSATKESYRIKEAIESVYFKESGIVNHPERMNKNISYYYMWKQLSAKTPCVLLEMGVAQDAHDSVLLNDANIIATAIAKGVCKAFNVEYEPTPVPTPEPVPVDYKKLYDDAVISIGEKNLEINIKNNRITQLETTIKEINDKLTQFKVDVRNYVGNYNL